MPPPPSAPSFLSPFITLTSMQWPKTWRDWRPAGRVLVCEDARGAIVRVRKDAGGAHAARKRRGLNPSHPPLR